MSMRSRSSMIWRVIAATATVVMIVAFVVAASLYAPATSLVDDVQGQSGLSQTVGASQMEMYCPARMSLADEGSYGDKEFQTSEGNLSSSARVMAAGSVYRASVTGIDGTSSSVDIPSLSDSQAASLLDMGSKGRSSLISGQALDVNRGTGVVGSIVSTATTGDLRGASASTCVSGSMKQSLFISGTSVGTTQQLVLANYSSTSTSVTISAHGAESGDAIVLSTGGTVTVPAGSEKTVDLSAAAPDHKALFLTLSSTATPVAAVVQSVSMSGLESRGSDFSTAVEGSSRRSVIPGVSSGDSVDLLLFSRSPVTVTASWLTRSGKKEIKKVSLTSGKVTSLDAGTAPANAYAIEVSSSSAVYAESVVTRTGDDGLSDFAYLPSSTGHRSAAVALPKGTSGSVEMANGSDDAATATVIVVNPAGSVIGSRKVTLDSMGVRSVSLSDFPSAAAVIVSSSSELSWGVRVSSSTTSSGTTAVAYLRSTPLEPTKMIVRTYEDRSIVR